MKENRMKEKDNVRYSCVTAEYLTLSFNFMLIDITLFTCSNDYNAATLSSISRNCSGVGI